MAEVASNFLFYVVKALIFAAVAISGIILGKKYRDKKDSREKTGAAGEGES